MYEASTAVPLWVIAFRFSPFAIRQSACAMVLSGEQRMANGE